MNNQENGRQEKIDEYIKKLNALGKGEKAALKRSLGQTLSNAGANAVSAFYKAAPYGMFPNEEDTYFLVATYACYFKDEAGTARNFIECLRRIKDETESGSMDKRVISLLDADLNGQDDYSVGKLSRLIRMVGQKGYKPDCNQLLSDLLLWKLPNRSIQHNWARAYFGEINKINKGE